MSANWKDQSWDEFKLLQGIIDRQMSTRWKIRAWLLGFQAALTVGLFSDKTDKDAFFWSAIGGALIAWVLEMSENFVAQQAIKRQSEIEKALNSTPSNDMPENFSRVGVCSALAVTAKGVPTILYMLSCLKKVRRVLILLLFISMPVLVRFILL
jgi:hypothetical protein